MGKALSTRNARIFFGASLTSWTGLWMHRIAVAWMTWEMTHSALWVGLIAFADLAPAVIASPIAGAVADRVDRLRLTQISQAAIAIEAVIVATLAGTGLMRPELLLGLEMMNGISASFSQPARQSLLPGLVGAQDLPAAIACNSLLFAIARFVGPAVAGPIIAAYGVVPAIAANAAAFAIAVASTTMLRVDPAARQGHKSTGSLWNEMVDGITYAARHPGLGPLFTFAALTALLLRGVQEILPPFVERVFLRGAESLALLTGCFGIGALFAGLWVASRGRLAGTTRLAVIAALLQALATAGFAATGWFGFGLVCAAAIGGTASIHGICVQQLAQSASDPAMRGRVISLWGLITRAFPAAGALSLGAAGEAFGLQGPVLVAVFLALFVFAWGCTRLPRMVRALERPASP